MFNKIREKQYIEKHIKKDLPVLFNELENIRNESDIIAICPLPTGDSWLGINMATKHLFSNFVFEIPQYFSRNIYSETELKQLALNINSLQFKQIIFSGYPYCPNYFSFLINNIDSNKAIIYHGTLSEINENYNPLLEIFELFSSNKIHKLAFIKKGLKEYFESLHGIKCYHLINKTPTSEISSKSSICNGINLGVFGNNTFNKNLINQVAAGLLIPDSNIHIISECETSFLKCSDRIIKHDKCDRKTFLMLMGSMSINTHVSFSESWGQIVTESLSLGVPCLTSNNNGIFDYDDYLAKKLIVDQFDNPSAIAFQLIKVLDELDEIRMKGKEYINRLNMIADEKLILFLSGK